MKQITSLLLLVISPIVLLAQTISSGISIKSPDAGAFDKRIETPVSYYTGVPNISIPIYEISIKGVTVPITLDYHAGGIRVDEEASSVGLGWKLNYGGAISRKIRGIPDENMFFMGGRFNGVLSNSMGIEKYQTLPGFLQDQYMYDRTFVIREAKAKTGFYDFMPDEFYYSVLGQSGRLLFSQKDHKFISYPKSDVLIRDYSLSNTLNDSYENYHPLKLWNVLLEDGISVDLGDDGRSAQTGDQGGATNGATIGWQIKRIKNLFNERIEYTYGGVSVDYYKFSGEQLDLVSRVNRKTVVRFNYGDPVINKISFPGGTVEFVTTAREDIPIQKISECRVYDTRRNLIKKIIFHYDYFYGNALDAYADVFSGYPVTVPTNQRYKRLRLDSVTIAGSSTKSVKYSFDYYTNGGQLPSKISYSQDHWGYFNGLNNTSLLLAPGARGRRVVPEAAKVFTLKTITYPEGGRSEFIYESNVAGNVPTEDVLMKQYVENDLLVTKSEGLGFSGTNNNNFSSTPVNDNGKYVLKKRFTITGIKGESHTFNGFSYYTNYGVYDMAGNDGPYYGTGKTVFKLERINADNTRATVAIYDVVNVGPNADQSRSVSETSVLKNGEYEIIIETYPYWGYPVPSFNNNYSVSFQVKWEEQEHITQVNVGGLRIKSINYYSANGVLARKKDYAYQPGIMLFYPEYMQATVTRDGVVGPDPIPNGIMLYSNSVQPLETTAGAYIGYQNLSETETSSATGEKLRTDYQFSFGLPRYNGFGNNAFGIVDQNEWERGKLLARKIFKGENIIHSETYEYNTRSPHLTAAQDEDYAEEINTELISNQSMIGDNGKDFFDRPDLLRDYLVGRIQLDDKCFIFKFGIDNVSSSSIANCLSSWAIPYFKRYTAFDKIKSKVTTAYGKDGQILTQTENYFYDKTPGSHQVSRIEIKNSRNENLQTKLKYSNDIAGTPEDINGVYTDMKSKNTVGVVVDKSSYKINNGVNTFYNSTKSNYGFWNGTNWATGPTGQIVEKNIEEKIGANSPETKIQVNHYDTRGNIQEQQKKDDIKEVYLWGYNKQYPVARVIGSDYATVSTLVSQAVLDNGTDAEIKTQLTTLRNGLASAPYVQLFTYTYQPLVGIITETDPNGKTIFYEYDHLNRLHLVRDENGNILKRICYNYAGQVEDCGVSANAQWVSTGITRCQPCPVNNLYTSSIRERQEKDNNPNSPTYNTYRWVSDGLNSNCIPLADWQNTATAIRCKKNGSNVNTGEQEREQRDMNPCSSTYNQLRWVVTGTSLRACPIPYVCTTGNCWQEGYKCVYGNCELGIRVCISSSYDLLSGLYENTYRYEWSDGSWSGNFVETTHFACAFTDM